jgi:ABC-type ATPase with predicted acetyltransferase domain
MIAVWRCERCGASIKYNLEPPFTKTNHCVDCDVNVVLDVDANGVVSLTEVPK